MKNVVFDYQNAVPFLAENAVEGIRDEILAAKETLLSRSGEGNDFLGWIDLPEKADQEEYARIKAAAKKIREDSDVLIVIGIGGSYLGARAAIEFLKGSMYNSLPKEKRNAPEIYFAGSNMSAAYTKDLLDIVGDRDFSINMISKSGTTTEPGIAFRVFKEKLIEKYGKEEAAKRIYATTDKARGALKTEANAEGYDSYIVPDDVGGRFSVLTAVGLLPIAVAGADLDAMFEGAKEMRKHCIEADFAENDALKYAAVRNSFLRAGKAMEIIVNYEPGLHSLAEWWKQLYGESEGKDHKGLFPASCDFTTDLHSLGQFIQDGSRIMFETVLHVQQPLADLTIPDIGGDLDGLAYLAGSGIVHANDCAMQGTVKAHLSGGTPCLSIELAAQDEKTLGALFYFFEFACGVSGYTLGVNPFNQPGVEAYKKNMFELLGKPGYTK